MKTALRLLMPAAAVFLTDCTSSKTASTAAPTPAPSSQVATTDALDDYGSTEQVSDPIEPLNRATFTLNHGLYNAIFRPISKGYTAITPKPVRQGVDNAFENAKFPMRFVNSGLQGKFDRAGKEVQKFGVNTFTGFGGLIKQSDRIPSLTDVPAEDTGQTLATWGLGHGPYIVLPIFGPSSPREVVGLAGDYALNPVNWLFKLRGGAEKTEWIPSAVNTVRSMPDQLDKYDSSRANSVDPYVSVRSVFYQNRKAASEQ
ncbi:MAG: VacJ family lipoprotein [Verrucomicrobia bacterium]|nr:VacJ family lipoprotein [Verrucomicrobiota bacterium]